jgi:hypothetical protein
MDGRISDARRKEIWVGLSDVFVDNETDYDYISRKVGDINIDQLKEIFFNDVAPICGPNLMTVIPPIWYPFDKDELANDIREMQERNRNSLIARIKHKLAVAFYHLRFAGYWRDVVIELKKRRPI